MPVTSHAVRSYHTISPLPIKKQAVYFLRYFPLAHATQALPGTLLYGARTFLHSTVKTVKQRLPSPLGGHSIEAKPQNNSRVITPV